MILTEPFSSFEIPVVNVPQTFNISLAGKNYTLTCRWNSAQDGGWFVDFKDADTGVDLVDNLPLITGANILDGLDYLGINGVLIASTDGDARQVPTLDNLGTSSHLYFATNEPNG